MKGLIGRKRPKKKELDRPKFRRTDKNCLNREEFEMAMVRKEKEEKILIVKLWTNHSCRVDGVANYSRIPYDK